MKKSMSLFLAALLLGAGTALLSGEPAASDAKPSLKDVPGSASRWPTVLEKSLPGLAKKPSWAKLGLWIREDGTVDEVEFLQGDAEWKIECIAAAKKMKFEPVVFEGTALPVRTELNYRCDRKQVDYNFSPLPNLPGEVHVNEEWGLTKPTIELDPDLILPLMLRARPMLTIEAAISYVVAEDGSTDKIRILGASSEGAVRSALDLIAERKYKPATVRDRPVRTEHQQVYSFQTVGKPIEALIGSVYAEDPVFPYERLLAGEEGYAVVKFTLDGDGKVESSSVLEASHPEFGSALVAAVDGWQFKPESIATAGAVREYRHDFLLSMTPYAARRLIAAARAGEEVSNAKAGLDAKPKVLASSGLAYPTALKEQKEVGSATVEFIIDRVGLAQLPRVLKASKPEFGWAAVTAVNTMRFAPLTRNGKSAELRVVMPVNFTPPKTEQAAGAQAPAAGG
ncbi:MAG: TonB family protein [Nibricoccus sp.]